MGRLHRRRLQITFSFKVGGRRTPLQTPTLVVDLVNFGWREVELGFAIHNAIGRFGSRGQTRERFLNERSNIVSENIPRIAERRSMKKHIRGQQTTRRVSRATTPMKLV